MRSIPGHDEWLENLFSADKANSCALYHVRGSFDGQAGRFDYTFTPPPGYSKQLTKRTEKGLKVVLEKREKGKSTPIDLSSHKIGKVLFDFWLFDRDPAVLRDVTDDVKGLKDYGPILAALNGLYVSCIHIPGNDVAALPAKPFERLQLIFLDLHLNNSVGKNAASHTANVFTKLVSTETAPILVVIWSKYAQVPDEGDATAAELFKATLFGVEPNYKDKLIFVEMPKPMPDARPEDWTGVLRTEIEKALAGQAPVEVLWAWDSMVRDACLDVARDLTRVAAASALHAGIKLTEGLQDAMQRLAKAQGEGDLSSATAPRHLVTVLTQLLMDQLDAFDASHLATHGGWLATEPPRSAPNGFAARMNGLLLTAAVSPDTAPMMPGTVYRFSNAKKFDELFGGDLITFMSACTSIKPTQVKWQGWLKDAWPVLIEISPECDVAQNNRVNALLVAGLIVPAVLGESRKANGDSFACLPLINLRWSAPDFPEQDAALIFCYRYKVAGPLDALPEWIEPWFRLREMPTAALRAAHASHSARVGYVLV